MDIVRLADNFGAMEDRVAALEAELKEAKADRDAAMEALVDVMTEEEVPVISRNGFRYSLQEANRYQKLGADKLAEAGVDFFEVLRNEGYGDLITETVNANTLHSAMKAYVAENGELSPELSQVVGVFERVKVTKKKETAKAGRK